MLSAEFFKIIVLSFIRLNVVILSDQDTQDNNIQPNDTQHNNLKK